MPILNDIQSSVPDCTYHVNVGMGHLPQAIEQYGVDLDPVYQRGHVWDENQESSFVGAMLENSRSIPPFWFNWVSRDHHRSHSEIVDGKQRIKAILRWLNREFTAICPCGAKVHLDDLDTVDHRNINMSTTMEWNFVDLSNKEVMKFYLRLNSGGTVHSSEELDRVRSLIEDA